MVTRDDATKVDQNSAGGQLQAVQKTRPRPSFCPQVLFVFLLSLASDLRAENVSFRVLAVSELPVHAFEKQTARANILAITGGKGVRNRAGRSRNYLVKQKATFISGGLNFYLLPNFSEQEKASYRLRSSQKRADRIKALVQAIKTRNSKPVFLIGFSRGTVDVGRFAKTYPHTVSGVVLASGIYTNDSSNAREYAMEIVVGEEIPTVTLIVHHRNDTCHVTPFSYAKRFFIKLDAPEKEFFEYSDGKSSGNACGPLNHHGFEGIESIVATDISKWLLSRAPY